MNYTSPTTGNTYEVTSQVLTRTDYGTFGDPDSRFEREYTQFSIYFEGQLVQFCFSEGDIPATVAWLENPWPDISSRFD
jgi:hypothetical protein